MIVSRSNSPSPNASFQFVAISLLTVMYLVHKTCFVWSDQVPSTVWFKKQIAGSQWTEYLMIFNWGTRVTFWQKVFTWAQIIPYVPTKITVGYTHHVQSNRGEIFSRSKSLFDHFALLDALWGVFWTFFSFFTVLCHSNFSLVCRSSVCVISMQCCLFSSVDSASCMIRRPLVKSLSKSLYITHFSVMWIFHVVSFGFPVIILK